MPGWWRSICAAYSERLGVARLERTVAQATLREPTDFSMNCNVSDGSRLQADLYIDCSGFRGVLIEATLKTGYLDWSDNLPCDRAVAMPTRTSPAARAAVHRGHSARSAGWHWRIPIAASRRATATSTRVRISATTEALEDLDATQVGEKPSRPIRAFCASSPAAASCSGIAIASRSGSPRAFSSRSNPPAFIW
jgi:hypothetical protein